MDSVGDSLGALAGVGESRSFGGVSWPPKTLAWIVFAVLIFVDDDEAFA
jgi:hypothetical protein